MEKRWSKTEIAHLKRNAGTKSVDELARRLKTDEKTVQAKLVDLGLAGKSGSSLEDAGLTDFEAGLKKLHKKDYAAAAKLFQKAADGADFDDVADRARQYWLVCQRQLGDGTADDPYLQAVFEKNRGELGSARALIDQHGDDGDGRWAYLDASVRALDGDAEGALDRLRSAIELDAKNRVHAYHDPDFSTLRSGDELAELLGVA